MCPLDEFPPGVPAPGTQGKLIAEPQAAFQEAAALVRSRELTPEWFTAQRLRGEAERAAHRAANPSPPPPAWAGTYDPMAPARAWLAERGGEPEGVRAAGEDARYEVATAAERREMPDAVLIRNGNAQLAFSRQAERWPTASAATATVATFAGSTVAAGSVAVPATTLLGLARTAAGLAQLAAAGLTITPAALAVLAAAAAAGAVIYLLQRQHRSLVDQGALPALPTDRANSMGYDMMGNPTGMPDPSWSGDEPRVLAPLPGFGDGPKAPTFQEEFSPAPALPQSTASPAPTPVIPTLEGFDTTYTSPATVFEKSELRKNMEAAEAIQPGQAGHHIVPGGGPQNGDRNAGLAQQRLRELGIDINGVENGVALSPDFHNQIHTKRYYDTIVDQVVNETTRERAIDVLREIGRNLQEADHTYQRNSEFPSWIE